jgi:HD superfamily phosphohydrolase
MLLQTGINGCLSAAKNPSKTIQHIIDSDNTLYVSDPLYGEWTVSEPVLVDLIRSRDFQRLHGVLQHGIASYIRHFTSVTRFEHSVGTMLLVRRLGGGLKEQIAALLHDVSHTAFSHVIDHVFDEEGSFHEVHKREFYEQSDLPSVLGMHGFEWTEFLHETEFPLLEQDAPKLCADRVDYGFRDSIAFQQLSLEDAQQIVQHLVAFPSADVSCRCISFNNSKAAKQFAMAYMCTDKVAWSEPVESANSRLVASIIRLAVTKKVLEIVDLWSTDVELWERLSQSSDTVIQKMLDTFKNPQIEMCESEREPDYVFQAKVRTIDPDVIVDSSGKLVPLSEIDPEYHGLRMEYLASKKAPYSMKLCHKQDGTC